MEMRAVILSLALMLASLGPGSVTPAQAQQSDIEGVIASQIEAFRADDFATAFTFAHPNIKNMFRTPENFGRMVRNGYPMVWRPAEVEYLELRTENGRTFQDVRVVDGNGRVFVLEYTMSETGEGWRIAGVRILETAEFSA
jgi:hypothetical protein